MGIFFPNRIEDLIKHETEISTSITLCRLLLEFPVLNEIYLGVTAENKKFSRDDIVNLIRLKSHITYVKEENTDCCRLV